MKYLIQLIQEFNHQICQFFRNDIFSFSFVVVFVTYLLLVLPRTYGVNDDIGILSEATQGFISEFTSFFYMKLLHFLYQVNNDMPWYGLTLYLAHILSLFIFIRSLARIKNFDTFFLPFLIVYLYFYSFFITQVDYTSASIMVGANSLFAFLVLLGNQKISLFYVFGLALLFSLSFAIRMQGAYAVLAYGLPILCLFLINQYQKTAFFAIFFIPFLLLFIGDNLARTYLTSQEYRQYHEFNSLRGNLHGYPILGANRNNKKILAANNWTQNDYDRFANWNFFDERKYNTNTLSNIFKYSVLKKENKIQKYLSLYFQKLSQLINHPASKWPFYFLLLISVLIIFKFYWFLALITFCYLSYIISFSIYLDIFYRFPNRIAHPLLLMCASFVILLIFHLWQDKFTTKNANHSILTTTFILCLFWFLFNVGMQYKISTNTAFKLSLQKLQSAYQGKILYISPLVFQWENLDPLKTYHSDFHVISAGGTNTFSPSFYNSLKKLGVNKGYEIIPALINNPNAYVITRGNNHYCIDNDIVEDYNIKCKAIFIEQLPNDSVIFKLKPKRISLWK